MSVAVITGSCGLVGSTAVEYFHQKGMDIVGIDNDARAEYFGPTASTIRMRSYLEKTYRQYRHVSFDIRNTADMTRVFRNYAKNVVLIIHAAAQPSHDWAGKNPTTDFEVNAAATSSLLLATVQWTPAARFIFLSTNKVYGDAPNRLPLVERSTRWEIRSDHPYHEGIPETFSIDQSMHSMFGASKLAADVLVQEYGHYYGLATTCFRCGCISGPNHSGVEQHGFLSYLMRCAMADVPYTVYGFHGKQVRDNIHAKDLVRAIDFVFSSPFYETAAVYNMGGGRRASCSVVEAINLCEGITGRKVKTEPGAERRGDHKWYISDTRKFEKRFPQWEITYKTAAILREIYSANRASWEART